MIDLGKRDVLGVGVSAIDYEAVVERVIDAAEAARPLTLSAAASHAIMTGHRDAEQRYRLNRLDYVVPDGQPVRHALRVLHGISLPDRVYGPSLTLRVCERAAAKGLPIYLYGGTSEQVVALRRRLIQRCAGLRVAGAEPSTFRPISERERDECVDRIRASGARLVLVGLGCPRQEVWVYEHRERLGVPLLAVGAAFAFHAGTLSQAPSWMQDRSLEWLYRLAREPRRLWRRYLGLGPWFVALVMLQLFGLRRFDPGVEPRGELRFG